MYRHRAQDRVGPSSSSMREFGASRSYADYAGRCCWFEFPPRASDSDGNLATTITRVNIKAPPNTNVEWTEFDGTYVFDLHGGMGDNGDLLIEVGIK